MIDFRYHLVSLVSVFLALAVGIVLGAGPLEGSIGRTLTDQVDALRADRDKLREDVDRAEQAVQHREEFITEITPALVAEQLGGRSVVMVTLPGVGTATLDSLSVALEDSGATVTGRVGITDKWVDPDAEDERADLVEELAATIPPPAQGQSTEPVPASVAELLSRAVVTGDLTQAGTLDATARGLLDGLQAAELVTVDGELTSTASEAVVVAPPVSSSSTTATATAGSTDDALSAWTSLASALDDGSDGTVVLGPATSAGQGGMIFEIRQDEDLAATISTVDTAGSAMGSVTTVLALTEQLRGSSGAYGFAGGAQAPLPEIDVDGASVPTVGATSTP
jgi:hypothetical protein